MDQLLVGHVCEQGHHGDFGVGPTQLLTGAQQRGLGTLELEEDLAKQRVNNPSVISQTGSGRHARLLQPKMSQMGFRTIYEQNRALFQTVSSQSIWYLLGGDSSNFRLSSATAAVMFPLVLRWFLLRILRALLSAVPRPPFVPSYHANAVLANTLGAERSTK